jgi:hypothetical protein
MPNAMLKMRDRDARITPIVPKMIGIVCESRTIVSQVAGTMPALGIGPEHVWLGVMTLLPPDVVLLIMFVLVDGLALRMNE